MIRKYGSIQVEEIVSDNYLIWRVELEKAGNYKEYGLSIGLRKKILDEALKRKVSKLIIKVGEPDLELKMRPKDFIEKAIEDKFPSKFGSQFDMPFLYLPIYKYLTK